MKEFVYLMSCLANRCNERMRISMRTISGYLTFLSFLCTLGCTRVDVLLNPRNRTVFSLIEIKDPDEAAYAYEESNVILKIIDPEIRAKRVGATISKGTICHYSEVHTFYKVETDEFSLEFDLTRHHISYTSSRTSNDDKQSINKTDYIKMRSRAVSIINMLSGDSVFLLVTPLKEDITGPRCYDYNEYTRDDTYFGFAKQKMELKKYSSYASCSFYMNTTRVKHVYIMNSGIETL